MIEVGQLVKRGGLDPLVVKVAGDEPITSARGSVWVSTL
jgi:hypothetical protein